MWKTLRISVNRLLLTSEGVHTELGTAVTNSSKIAPVNLEMSFAAEEESKEKLDRPGSPWASNKGL